MPAILSQSLSSPSVSALPIVGISMTRSLSSNSTHLAAKDAHRSSSSSSSTSSVQLVGWKVEPVIEEGLLHATVKLDAKTYKTSSFATKLLKCLLMLEVPSWRNIEIEPSQLVIHKVSGSLTNSVFFVSCPTVKSARTLLLRIYGPSSGSLISRPRELHTLHVLSSRYGIGPRVYGTFENGRVEEYFESITLSSDEIHNPQISRWIAARMAELHSVDIDAIEDTCSSARSEGNGWEISVKKNIRSWISPAEEVLSLSSVPEFVQSELNLSGFKEEWIRYMRWLAKFDDIHTGSRRVFAHNDTQYGNLLRLKHPKAGRDDHRQIIVVDFEYASPNPASYDIANHFHEWTADYHSSTPHLLDPSRYPSLDQRRNFYAAYLRHSALLDQTTPPEKTQLESQIMKLDRQVRIWSPASHALWAIWGIVQARDDIERNVKEPEFDYIGYARGRMAAFRLEIDSLGVL